MKIAVILVVFSILTGSATAQEGRFGTETLAPNYFCVDAVHGNDDNEGLTPGTALATIQRGINKAADGDVILVYPGLYQEEIDFRGKAIVVQGVTAGTAGIPVLHNPDDFAVSFYNGEGPDSILKNFIIANNFVAVFIAGSSPTISNLTIVDNMFGIEASANSEPDISNIIFWNNSYSDLFGCQVRYSRIDDVGEGRDNINDDPLFVDPENGDYRLRSNRGRYWPEHDTWVLDGLTSPCVDAGDPNTGPLDEPAPNGGRINMGAYGGTAQASLSPSGQPCLLPDKASNPYPADGAEYIEGSVVSWTAGLNAVLHDVYFSTHEESVAENDISNRTGTYRGRQAAPSYTPFNGFWSSSDPSIYWRIDEVDSEGNITKGDVWTFKMFDPPSPVPPKGRTCFTAETGVWVNGALVLISSVGPRQCVGRIDNAPAKNSSLTLPYLGKVEQLQEHVGVFNCYDILLQSGNSISVAENHYFLTESGNWTAIKNLKTEMKLQTPNGSIGIVSVTKRPMPYVGKVYNLKVEGLDRYLVGKDAVIVRDY